MSRNQLILFSVLITISIVFLLLNNFTSQALAVRLSSVFLFPVKTVTELVEFFSISSVRIEELEVNISRLKLENTQLKHNGLIDTTALSSARYQFLKAHITGRDPSNINGFLYIDKGTVHGLHVNQPVISINGLIGKVKFVDPYYSIVETIENQGFALSGTDVQTGIHGMIKQRNGLIFDYTKITDQIGVGDSIFTSGMSEIFPSGILIGTVREIHQTDEIFFKKVEVTPSVQINRLTSVYLILGSETKDLRIVTPPNNKSGQ